MSNVTEESSGELNIIQKKQLSKSSSTKRLPRYNLSLLKIHEQDLLMHQYYILSRSIFERKWGICGLTIYKMFRNLSVDAKKQLKMSIENEIKKMDLKGVTQIRSEVKIALQKEKPSISLEKIYEFGLNKGIAVAAIKYSIDLFKLEYLIWKQCPTLWAQMKTNNWFLIPVRNWSQSKLGIIKMAESEGVLYTSKKCRINLETIYRYIERYNEYGKYGL